MSRDLAARFLLSCGAAVALACAGARPAERTEAARVSVEVLSGAKTAPTPAPAVAIVVDASASMRSAAAPGVSRLAAAQTRARELIGGLAPEVRVQVDVAGGEGLGTCSAPARVAGLSSGAAAASDAIAAIEPGGDAALATAMQQAARSLAAQSDGGRVIVFSDLEDDCQGDLCAATSSVLASGASLDIVVLGDHPTPACFESASAHPPVVSPAASIPDRIRFAVTPEIGSGAEGIAGAPAIAVPAGSVRIVVDLAPPLEIGPVTLAPGALARLRIVDFPAATPPVREWSLELVGSGGDIAESSSAVTSQRP